MDRVDESEGSKAIALKAIRGVFIERDARVVQELFAPGLHPAQSNHPQWT
jgi:hypothetical protein